MAVAWMSNPPLIPKARATMRKARTGRPELIWRGGTEMRRSGSEACFEQAGTRLDRARAGRRKLIYGLGRRAGDRPQHPEDRPGRSCEKDQEIGSPSRTRTCDKAINSRLLYQLSYRGSPSDLSTHQSGAAKSRLDHLDETSSRTTTWFHRTKTSNNALKQSLRPERIWLPEQDSNLRQSD